MSKMLAEIRRIVDEDISNRVTQYDVLYEAITNSIHAGASKIVCVLNSLTSSQIEIDNDVPIKKVDSITITDNGNGFNNENYNSFCKYRTEYKKDIGGKGVGRFVFLKLYENVHFKSLLVKEKEIIEFHFNVDFDTDNLKKVKSIVNENQTEISLTSLTAQYFNTERSVDRRINLDLEVIREKVLLNLIPSLFFYKKKGKAITIEFTDSATLQTTSIESENVPYFNEKIFEVKNRDGRSVDFRLNYLIDKTLGKLHAYYCANSRTVCEFSDKDLKITLPIGYSGFFLVEAEYLNAHVNINRNDFDIYPVRTDMFSSLSWEMINESLKRAISAIVKAGIPETEVINKSKLQEIQNERPYLTNYIEEEDIDMAGFLDKKHIIEKAKRRFDHAKENVLASSGKESYTHEELTEAILITQNELISYINDRVQVIERLKTLIDKQERVESIIHSLFMEKHTESDYFSVGVNNLWLLDDRFTTYSYAASDKKISSVLDSIGENFDNIENGNDKPDLSIFFSNNPNTPGKLKSVLIELKPFDFSTKSDRKKFQGIQQLIDYVKAFMEKERIQEIFSFLITDIDSKLAERLVGDGYVPLFSTEAPIFHRFYEKMGISIYVVSARTLILDAEARNKIFLDIIRKQSRLNKLLSKG
jgi:hypothetical protein